MLLSHIGESQGFVYKVNMFTPLSFLVVVCNSLNFHYLTYRGSVGG